MFLNLLHRTVARPAIYDLVQSLVGLGEVNRRLSRLVRPYDSAQHVLDLGGGTGTLRKLWTPRCKYICLDHDFAKLNGFRRRFPIESALLADATQVPIRSHSVDVVTCTAVAHHLSDPMLKDLLRESQRVLRTGGAFIFWDAVLAEHRWASRLLWHLDRGSFPRPAETLCQELASRFTIKVVERLAIYHEYLICICESP